MKEIIAELRPSAADSSETINIVGKCFYVLESYERPISWDKNATFA
jgi:hypothetical protein